MDGSDKLKPFVIGKSAKPLAFRDVRNIQHTYTLNKKTWMTSEIFKQWLCLFDARMGRKTGKSCYPAHPKLLKHHIRTMLASSLLRKVPLGKDLLKWNVLDDLRATAFSWEEIQPETFAGCFRHARFHNKIPDEADDPKQPQQSD
ncbi:hypothetical protein PR048_010121 [Dryococelus australis]|uniref:DDE-1 domain-containing protein n=1 Tax=Dryococelus australis TaxID=614101 RepID=A0ABQ9I1T4_9NEOP|nr:hypothetical protein PR048_010121 [Dryococelus australis]